jgi:hypothetical protein
MERDAAAVNSSESLRSPPGPLAVIRARYDAVTGLSLAKEKNPTSDPERGIEEPGARHSKPSSVAVSSFE